MTWPEGSIESIVELAFQLNPGRPVEPFLGNYESPRVAIVGFNPGGQGHVPALTADNMDGVREYCRTYFRSPHLTSSEFDTVWRRYCWMLDPCLPEYPKDRRGFGEKATEQLLVMNIYQVHSTGENDLASEDRNGKGEVALRLLKRMNPRPDLLVAQGRKAWKWIREQTTPTTQTRGHRPLSLIGVYSQEYDEPLGYEVQFNDVPGLCINVLPVIHLTGQQHFLKPHLRFDALEARYRRERNWLLGCH